VVEQAAFRDACRPSRGLQRRCALTAVDEDALERVEDGVAGCRWATHVVDRTDVDWGTL